MADEQADQAEAAEEKPRKKKARRIDFNAPVHDLTGGKIYNGPEVAEETGEECMSLGRAVNVALGMLQGDMTETSRATKVALGLLSDEDAVEGEEKPSMWVVATIGGKTIKRMVKAVQDCRNFSSGIKSVVDSMLTGKALKPDLSAFEDGEDGEDDDEE